MAILVMDTATVALGVGVGSADGQLLSGAVQRILRGHSRLLQPSIQFVLESSGVKMGDIEEIGVGIGPGSYTGVRMAVATGKAMAHAWNVPIVPIPTLDAIAQLAAPGERADGKETRQAPSAVGDVVLVLLYARRDRAFGGVYLDDGIGFASSEPATVKGVDAWLQDARVRTARSVTVVHDFPPNASPVLAEGAEIARLHRIVHWSDVASSLPSALLRMAVRGRSQAISGAAIHNLAPDYALPVEAEVKLREKAKGESVHESSGR